MSFKEQSDRSITTGSQTYETGEVMGSMCLTSTTQAVGLNQSTAVAISWFRRTFCLDFKTFHLRTVHHNLSKLAAVTSYF